MTDRNDMDKREAARSSAEYANHLIHECSPYLLQHADNPVDWYPWGEEAFERARNDDKPIFLSIGYSTCHWCHVMQHESFEDTEVAALMNESFICIKVDREERPDIDNVYMAVCQMMTGSGGWPLTIVMTPDKRPFFAATFIPKSSRFGRMGMMELVPKIAGVWKNQRSEVLISAEKNVAALQGIDHNVVAGQLGEITLAKTFDSLKGRYDPVHGGFAEQRKFPMPHNYLFLLRYWKRTGDDRALEMVDKSLRAMRGGGMFDHVGFGFHRYSTDPEWLLPHFEKMLYDQALLAMAFLEMYQATHDEFFARSAREVFTYVQRDITSYEGGFCSAEDADSEGKEGKFYVWTMDELIEVLGSDDARLFSRAYNCHSEGNFKEESTGLNTGENILHLKDTIDAIAAQFDVEPDELSSKLGILRLKLFSRRESRIHPAKDDKILTDWNGLMIAALAQGAVILQDTSLSDLAEKSARFIMDSMRTENGGLYHRYRDGDSDIQAYVDDYAFMIWGLIELYESTFDVRYLRTAVDLNNYLIEHFWDESTAGLFFTADNSESLIHRSKEIYDGAVPSGNAVAMYNFLRLARITGDMTLEQRAHDLALHFGGTVSSAPANHTMLMCALDFAVGPSHEVVISGSLDSESCEDFLDSLRSVYLPNKVVLHRPDGESPEIATMSPFVLDQKSIGGKPTAYVCVNHKCKVPTTDPDEMISQLLD
jgi:uncharacterized protein YyaL (SSP411 family)